MISRPFSLTPKEIAALRSVRPGGISSKEMAASLHVSAPGLSRLTRSLESKGLITIRKKGMAHAVALSDLKHAIRLRRVFDEHGHMKLEKILSLASLKVVAALTARPGSTRGEIVSSSGVSARTLQTTIGRLRALGILRIDGRGEYSVPDRFAPLMDFVREFNSYANQRAARDFSADSVVVWEEGAEFLVRTKRTSGDDRFMKTAFSAFEEHGLPLLQGWHYYYHPCGEWRRTAVEVLLQSLLIRPLSTRELTMILVFWEKNGLGKDVGRIKDRAERYGLVEEVERIAAYFDDPVKNRWPGFPKLSEVRERMRG